jgi:hypothetical protein
MICAHCDRMIRPGEEYERIPVDTASAAAPDVVRHREPCRRTPQPIGQSVLQRAVRRWG